MVSEMALRDNRGSRALLFDGLEEGGLRASSFYTSAELAEQENERSVDGLQDRVSVLKRLTADIHEEVESHNSLLDRMGIDMDSSKGLLSGVVDRFTHVFSDKSNRTLITIVSTCVALFLLIHFVRKW
eukprot:TRINITY_DN8175_c0_g1_i2.p1 TRINITY_DN8175_c0_g1~~TRINITY_DN8175_c0_g1_i2.p1  ORF type:complete len:128 (+),score=13.79 TRINITY_DN8175_c0_g1_i2:197-580(+)